MQLLSRLKQRLAVRNGFTLIEMLVVAPIAIIAIATLISLMVALVGDVSVSRERSVSSYSVQDALDRIEQDARIATTYMPSFSIVSSPQGRDGNTAPFNTSSGDIILSQYATTSNPYDASRQIVYYADQPNPCNGSYTLNRPLTVRVIYFTTGTAGNQTLWRRVIVPPYSTTSSDTTHVCAQPWQRDNCPAPVTTITSTCQAEDEKILTNVSNFSTTYYTSTGATTTDVRNADSMKVSLTQSIQVTGETVATSGVTRASHINATTDNVPTAPNVYVYNPTINVYNNPVLTTFAWDIVPNAAVYGIQYQIVNSQGTQPVVNAPDQTGNQFQINEARPGDDVWITVTAKNDMGNSTSTNIHYKKPIWTVANLENDWDCYQPSEATYPCPSYTLTLSGMVVIRGLAANGTNGTSVFTLPPGLRPRQQQIFPISVTEDYGRADVYKDGRVVFVTSQSATTYVALDMLRFNALGTPGVTWNNASIAANWSDYGGSYSAPSYTMDSAGRVLVVGLLNGNGTAGLTNTGVDMLTLASGYQPPLQAIYANYANVTGGFSNIQTTTGYKVQARGTGAGSSWNSVGAIYYPSGTSVAQYPLTLANGWVRYSTGYNNAEYGKGSDSVVSLRGLIKAGTITRGTVIGTLPAGYRPGKREIFTTVGINTTGGVAGQTFARVDVDPAGNIYIMNLAGDNLSNSWLSLENIHFYQEN